MDNAAMFREWLRSGTDAEKAHARYALGLQGQPGAIPEPEPAEPACPYRESCACSGGAPVCYHPANGPKFGKPSTMAVAAGGTLSVHRVTGADCDRCRTATAPSSTGAAP